MTDEQFNKALVKLNERRQFFMDNFPEIPGMKGHSWVQEFKMPNTCPVCGFYTLEERDSWDVCGICWWEDDGQDEKEFGKFNDPNKIMGGPNANWSLTSYRRFFYESLADEKLVKGTRIKALLKKFDQLKENYSTEKNKEIVGLIGQLEKEFKPFHDLRLKMK